MTRFLYIVGDLSTHDHKEMRYSLRSVAKHHPKAHVIIAGYKPNFVTNVQHIVVPEPNMKAGQNTYIKLQTACEQLHKGLYVLMNDDFFLLKPHLHCRYIFGTLRQRANESGDYTRMLLEQTMHLVADHSDCYELHAPQTFNSAKMWTMLRDYRERMYGFGVAYNSLYGNKHKDLPINRMPFNLKWNLAPKSWKEATNGLPAFSISDSAIDERLWAYLHSLYPERCKYELS